MSTQEERDHVERLAATRAATVRYVVAELAFLVLSLGVIAAALYCCTLLAGLK